MGRVAGAGKNWTLQQDLHSMKRNRSLNRSWLEFPRCNRGCMSSALYLGRTQFCVQRINYQVGRTENCFIVISALFLVCLSALQPLHHTFNLLLIMFQSFYWCSDFFIICRCKLACWLVNYNVAFTFEYRRREFWFSFIFFSILLTNHTGLFISSCPLPFIKIDIAWCALHPKF